MAPTTDSQWLERLAVHAPEDFSPEEIADLRQRLGQSAALRDAVVAQLQTDQMLAHLLREVNISVDEIVERAGRGSRRQARGRMVWLALAASVILLTGIGGWVFRDRLFSHSSVNGDLSAGNGSNPSGGSSVDPADDSGESVDPNEKPKPTGPPLFRLEVEAESFVRGNAIIDTTDLGKGIGIIHTPKRGGAKEGAHYAEYDLDLPKTAVYQLDIRYASEQPRPFRVLINGKTLTDVACAAKTGGPGPTTQRWSSEGVVLMPAGKNLVRFETYVGPKGHDAGMPSIDKFALIETRDSDAPDVPLVEAKKPWEEDNQLGGPPRPFNEVCFDAVGPDDDALRVSDFIRWFAGGKAIERNWPGRVVVFDGSCKLIPAWPDDAALRLAFSDLTASRFSLRFWRADRGVELQYIPEARQWAAYELQRSSDKKNPAPIVKGLLATDSTRNGRLDGTREAPDNTNPSTYDFRCQQGQLILSRGNVQVFGAAFAGLPDEVQLEGHAAIRAIAMIHSPGAPEAPNPKRTVVWDSTHPADQAWSGETPKGATFSKIADGAVELRCGKIAQRAWQGFKLPKQTLGDLTVELDDIEPGTRFYLGDDQCKPLYTVAFAREKIAGLLTMAILPVTDPSAESYFNRVNFIAPYIPTHLWLRIVFGCGTLKTWASADGMNWNSIAPPAEKLDASFSSIGLGCFALQREQAIKLRRVTLRQFDNLMSLAPAALFDRAVVPKAATLNEWLDAVGKQKPADVAAVPWRRACALRTVAMGTPRALCGELVDVLFDTALAGATPADRMLDLLDEVALLSDTWNEQANLVRLLDKYERYGEKAYRGSQTSRPFSLVATRWFEAPILSLRLRTSPASRMALDALYRTEIYELLYGQQWDELRALVRQVRTWNRDEPLLGTIDARLGHATVQIVRLTKSAGGRSINVPVRIDRRHPLVDEFNKDGFNTMAEFEGALANKAYRDACQMISAVAGSDVQGVLPHSADPNLLVSLSTELGMALRENPALRKAMVDDFGSLAALRYKAANNENDAVAMHAVGVQFQGTPAAGDAYLWLGDRALTGGDFLDAREQYRLAEREGSNASPFALAIRKRLSAALLGFNEGQPVTVPVELGSLHLSAADFEAIIADLQQRGASRALRQSVQSKFCDPAPAAVAFDARLKQHFADPEGSLAELPEALQGRSDIDWAGRQIALALDGGMLYFSNHVEVCALDAASGERKWSLPASPAPTVKNKFDPRTVSWMMTPLRPLPAGNRVFVRRLALPGCELLCLNAADGKIIWRTRSGITISSDPVLVQDQLFALTVAGHDNVYTLNLAVIDASTGSILTEHKLADIRDSWWPQRTCQLSPLGNNLVAICGASVIAFDFSGRLRWIRRQEWFSDPEDHGRWAAQRQQPALVSGERLFVAQPGVRAIECLDTDSGRLKWRKVLPTIRAAVDLLDNRLIVETNEGFLALDADTGKLAWQHDVKDILEAQLCGGPGKLVYLRRERAADDPKVSHPMMVWLDSVTGKPTAQWLLTSIKGTNVEVGPLAVGGGRIWTVVGQNDKDPSRDLFELVPTGQPAQGL